MSAKPHTTIDRRGSAIAPGRKKQLVFQALLDYNPSGLKIAKDFEALPDGRFG
jgi:hypothetical protein